MFESYNYNKIFLTKCDHVVDWVRIAKRHAVTEITDDVPGTNTFGYLRRWLDI